MKTLTISELENWYLKKLSDRTKDFRKQAEKSYKIVEQALRDIKDISATLKEASDEEDAESQGTATRFANKIDDIVARFDVKTEITYHGTEELQEAIQYFIQEIWGAGARWIRRMDKKYKGTIKQLDVYMKELINEMKKIGKLLYENNWIKDLERIQGRIETMREISYGTELYEEKIRQVKLKIEQAQKEHLHALQAYDEYKDTSNVAELLSLDEESERIGGLLRMKLNILKKTVKKFMQVDTGVRISPSGQKALTEYFENPYAAIAAEPNGYPALIEGLEGLQKGIENGSLKIKDRLARRSIEEIQLLKKGSLQDLQDKAKDIENKRVQYAGSDVYAKNRELAAALDEAKRNLEYHRNDLLKIRDDIRREIEKFEDFKSRVASEILEAFAEAVEIKVETLGLTPLLEKCSVP
ncbi:MAG: hypothetical protein ACFFEF_01265 [Candidatus Thorarchaeota archaeon]